MFPVTLSCSYKDYNIDIDSIGRDEYMNFGYAWINERMNFALESNIDVCPLKDEDINLTYTHISVTFVFKTEQDALLFTIRYK